MGSMLPYIAAPWILWVSDHQRPSVEGEILQQGHGIQHGNTDHEADSVRCV